jgi:hypothetical protein
MPPSQRWNGAAVGHQVPYERVGGLDAGQRLSKVDEIDPVALTQNEALHLRVPSPRLVAEVDSGFQKLSHGNDGHSGVSSSRLLPWRSAASWRRPWNARR